MQMAGGVREVRQESAPLDSVLAYPAVLLKSPQILVEPMENQLLAQERNCSREGGCEAEAARSAE